MNRKKAEPIAIQRKSISKYDPDTECKRICKNCSLWIYCKTSGADPDEEDNLCFTLE